MPSLHSQSKVRWARLIDRSVSPTQSERLIPLDIGETAVDEFAIALCAQDDSFFEAMLGRAETCAQPEP